MTDRPSALRFRVLAAIAGEVGLLIATAATARIQRGMPAGYSVNLSTPPQRRPPSDANEQKAGSVASSSVGAAGQRQERVHGVANIRPLGRLETRIANRVQSRVRNRIDRYYDPRANATSPFKVAADQARAASPQSRR